VLQVQLITLVRPSQDQVINCSPTLATAVPLLLKRFSWSNCRPILETYNFALICGNVVKLLNMHTSKGTTVTVSGIDAKTAATALLKAFPFAGSTPHNFL
jgi:hypothetical protein